MQFQTINSDQQREYVNSQQRYDLLQEAERRARAYQGSMTFSEAKGREYLVRTSYDPKTGLRRQKSLGPMSEATQALHNDFHRQREQANIRLADARKLVERQAGINRALGLGRVPLIGARILRALSRSGLIGRGLRVVGTNALYAYEAATGVRFLSDITTTEDIDFLFDARASLRFVADEEIGERSLMGILKRVDRSFERTERRFQASNRDGYLVDLIRPMRNPPWREEREGISDEADDLESVQIEGLGWQESAPAFAALAIDASGLPVPMIATDPRAFAVHKLWLSRRADRSPVKRLRDAAQARAVASLVAYHLLQLPFDKRQLRSFPLHLVEAAEHLFRRERGAAEF